MMTQTISRYKLELTDGALSPSQLSDVLKHMGTRAERFRRLESYYQGYNKRIYETSRKVGRLPVPISYGRRIVNTIIGYMFKPRNIGYSSDNEAYKEQLDDVLYANHEEITTTELGKAASIYGVSYEIHFVGEDEDGRLVPKFVVADPKEVLGIYSYDIGDDDLIAAVRWYEIDRAQHVDVYYPDRIDKYQMNKGGSPRFVDSVPHMYGGVPVVEYENNAERQGDFEHIIPLIDAYDILMSDSIHEVDKLAEAYLVLTNAAIDADDVDKMRYNRIIELMEGGKAEFLVKNVNPVFLKSTQEWIKSEIHQQSQVPDMTDDAFGGNQSGIAIRYKLNSLENLCSVKEALFRRGLYERFRLVDRIMDIVWGDVGNVREIDITFTRNIPQNYVEIGQIVQALRGHVSLQTLLEEVVPFVTNAADEVERLEAETDPYVMPELTDDGDA